MRRDRQRLQDVLDALDGVARMITEQTEAGFLKDETLRYAVAQRLTVVGEAAARLSAGVRQQNPSVPWNDIVGFRNILVHEYFGIHWPLVWQTAADHARRFASRLLRFSRRSSPTERLAAKRIARRGGNADRSAEAENRRQFQLRPRAS
jgi:uncharacterized protein with HEPN domain